MQSMKLSDFALGKQLGQGKFGSVWKAKHKKSGKIVVLKVMRKQELIDEDVVHQIKREVEIHYRCRHESIVKMHCYFQTAEQLFLVLEYANSGTLYDMLRSTATQCIDEATAASFLCQMLDVLHYLRTSKAVPIIHRDIKPENILVQKHSSGPYAGQLKLKLADFGWAVAMVPDSYRVTLCGTPEYMPPEVVQEDAYSGAFDVWTLGVLLYEMLLGTTPFQGAGQGVSDETDRMDAIMNSIVQGHFSVPESISEEAEDLLRGMLTADQHERMTPGAIRRHAWVVAHCGEPDAATFAPSRAGSRLVHEAKRRAAAAAGGGSGDAQTEEAPAAQPVPAAAPVAQPAVPAAEPVADAAPSREGATPKPAVKSTGGPRRVLQSSNATNAAKKAPSKTHKAATAGGMAQSSKAVTTTKGATVKRTVKRAPKTRSTTGAVQVR